VLLTYSEGFRAPTFNDLYYPDYSNPDPETRNLEELRAAMAQPAERQHAPGSLAVPHRFERRDHLRRSGKPQNVASARINGFEAALKQELFGWQGNLGLAIIDPRDRDSGHTLARRASAR
jgi:vitamin B12 transporter